MRVRIEGDAHRLVDFITRHNYPAPWSSNSLQHRAIMLRLEPDEGGPAAGFVWATWHPTYPMTLDFHACISPAHRGSWLTDQVWNDFRKMAEFLGAEMLSTNTIGDRAARLVAAMLIRRFGFKQADDGTVYRRL